MKLTFFVPHLALAALTGMLLAGCLFNPVTVSTRHFVLAPTATNEPVAVGSPGFSVSQVPVVTPTERLSIGVGFVKMPPYLLRNSIAVRNGANEIQYLEDARWGERLDQSFQRTVAANLSRLLPSDSIFLSDWARDQVTATVSINVHQFDVDTRGHGTLIVQWRITAPDTHIPSKIGRTQFERAGASPHRNPQAIAATLNDLTADFSRVLAQSIRESTKRTNDSIAATVKAVAD